MAPSVVDSDAHDIPDTRPLKRARKSSASKPRDSEEHRYAETTPVNHIFIAEGNISKKPGEKKNSSPPIVGSSPSTLGSSPHTLKSSPPIINSSPLTPPPAETRANEGLSQHDTPREISVQDPHLHAAWILNFVSSHKDALLFQIDFHNKELERSRAHAATQKQCIRFLSAQLAAFNRFEIACTAAIRSHGIDIESIAPISTRVPLPNWCGPAHGCGNPVSEDSYSDGSEGSSDDDGDR